MLCEKYFESISAFKSEIAFFEEFYNRMIEAKDSNHGRIFLKILKVKIIYGDQGVDRESKIPVTDIITEMQRKAIQDDYQDPL